MRRYWLWVVIIVQLLLVFSLVRGLINSSSANQRVEELKRKKVELEEIQAALKSKKTHTESEYYLEKVAREQLNLVKPGEIIVIVPELEGEREKVVNKELEKSNWRLWLEIFLN